MLVLEICSHLFLVSISHRVSKASLGLLEPLDLREYLVKMEIWVHLDAMEIRYVHVYFTPPPPHF